MRRSETVVLANDGTRLFVRHYSPAANDAQRTIVIVHGASEHGGRYEHVVQECVRHGWNVLAADLRGHGHSGGPRVHVDRFDCYLDDLQTILDRYSLRPRQTVLLGHSLGGLIAVRFAQTVGARVSAVVVTSPLLELKVPIPFTTLAAGRLVSLVAPRTRFRSRVNPADTTRNVEVLRRRETDPLIVRTVTARWFFQMKRAVASAWDEAHKLHLPLLAVQAGQDEIVAPDAVEPWLRTVGSPDATLMWLPDHLHEVLNEPDWQTTVSSILSWLDQRVEASNDPCGRSVA